jgi:hypothetical protein
VHSLLRAHNCQHRHSLDADCAGQRHPVSNIVLDPSQVATDTIDYVATDQNGFTATSTNIVLYPSQVATDTIDYVATDQNGFTATSTRIVIIEPAAAPSIIPMDDASTTAPSP